MKELLKHTFLWNAWHRSKLLIAFLFSITVLSAIGGLTIGWQSAPFYTYMMFSTPLRCSDQFVVYEIRCNGRVYSPAHGWEDFRRMAYMYAIPYYDDVKNKRVVKPGYGTIRKGLIRVGADTASVLQPLFVTEQSITQFPGWLKKYLQQFIGEPLLTIELRRQIVEYTPNGNLRLLTSSTIFKQ